MIAALLLAAIASPTSVRAEPVESPAAARAERSPSTRSGRTELGSALDAERAFAADAQALGQWTAFRKWAAADATMFVPQPVNAQAWLKDRTDPAKAISWWPTASYVSCDGSLALNTGGWKRPDGSVGYFSTVWQRQPDGGWKWIVDGGDDLKVGRDKPRIIQSEVGSCAGTPTQDPILSSDNAGGGRASDRTLGWMWEAAQDGSRRFWAAIWTGKRWKAVVDDKIAAPK
ncbi:MAG: hypothetical protein ACRCS5_04395 [Sphingomonas sp.]|uniref:hypothetical protein n=1 Tax=Sphingomonas sp. TaxID=28214 RepID=UPI0030F5BCD5